MARSRITNTTEDLLTDSGAVLWSFVKGEQLEYPITLDFIESTSTVPYSYEAVVIEALNVAGQTDRPVTNKPNGVQTVLTVRVPLYRGVWDSAQAYNTEDVVLYNGLYYRKLREATEAVVNSTIPSASTKWTTTAPNRIYVQFPLTLGGTWAVEPQVDSPVYGFFELRVSEPSSYGFPRTWKPIRGMVELLFSPTHLVPG
jgi:hypothetical protein